MCVCMFQVDVCGDSSVSHQLPGVLRHHILAADPVSDGHGCDFIRTMGHMQTPTTGNLTAVHTIQTLLSTPSLTSDGSLKRMVSVHAFILTQQDPGMDRVHIWYSDEVT